MLAWPAIALLKTQYPDSEITALVPAYTEPMARLCPWIDQILLDNNETSIVSSAHALAKTISAESFDASISYFSEARTALALWLARIPYRIGPATKLAQIFLNRTLRQRRSSSAKPEYEYNIDLSRFYIEQQGDHPMATPSAPYLTFPEDEITTLKARFRAEHAVQDGMKLVFIHPGSGGSAINLSLDQYAQLADSIAAQNNIHVVITCGPDELTIASKLASMIKRAPVSLYHSTSGIVEFSRLISICDLFISGSTGPLHIAGALNVPTAAFYPSRRSATALRWQTTNEDDRRIIASARKNTSKHDTLQIDIDPIIYKLNKLLSAH